MIVCHELTSHVHHLVSCLFLFSTKEFRMGDLQRASSVIVV
jgi:hypothetical protein